MQEYILNFFVWWYGIKVKEMTIKVRRWELFVLKFTLTVDMARNLFVPMFQDNTRIGKVISLFIRLGWAIAGGVITLIMVLPVLVFLLVYAMLPILVILQIVLGSVGTVL